MSQWPLIFFLVLQLGRFALGCNTVNVSNKWPGGYSVGLNIPIVADIGQWIIDVTFSSAVSSLHIWNAESSTNDNLIFRLVNKDYNGHQVAGSLFNDVAFNVAHENENSPQTVSVLFNGVNICEGIIDSSTTLAIGPTRVESSFADEDVAGPIRASTVCTVTKTTTKIATITKTTTKLATTTKTTTTTAVSTVCSTFEDCVTNVFYASKLIPSTKTILYVPQIAKPTLMTKYFTTSFKCSVSVTFTDTQYKASVVSIVAGTTDTYPYYVTVTHYKLPACSTTKALATVMP